MPIHQRDRPRIARIVHGGNGVNDGDGITAVCESGRFDARLCDAAFEQVSVHGQRVESGSLNGAFGMNVERSAGINDWSDVGHAHGVAVTQATVEERCGKQCVGHRVLLGNGAEFTLLDQLLGRLVTGFDGCLPWEARVMPDAQVPFVERDLDSVLAIGLFRIASTSWICRSGASEGMMHVK